MPLDGTESILAIPRKAWDAARGDGSGFLGFVDNPGLKEWLLTALASSVAIPRTDTLEKDESWLQLVSYGVLTHERRVFVYRRAKVQGEGEPRLLGKASIGIGGHYEPQDLADNPVGFNPWIRGMLREYREEMNPSAAVLHGCEPVGVLFDESDPVGRVHLGLIFRLTVLFTDCFRTSPGIDPVGWMTVPELKAWSGEREVWDDPDRCPLLKHPIERWSVKLISSMTDGAPAWKGLA